jgi:uridine phosphorylase
LKRRTIQLIKNSFPNYPGKFANAALFSPAEYLKYLAKQRPFDSNLVPECAIILFQPGLYKRIKQRYAAHKIGNVLEVIQIDDKKLGLARVPGIGAPAAVVVLEELIGLGVRQFIAIGTAGGLQKNLKIGDFVVCETAIRDEGTSYHYLEPGKYASGSPALTQKLRDSLNQSGYKIFSGMSWSVDAPYRETTDEVRQYQSEGVLTVEMEAAALFSVAHYRNVALAATFVITDSLADLKWNPQFFSLQINSQLELLFNASAATLLNTE